MGGSGWVRTSRCPETVALRFHDSFGRAAETHHRSHPEPPFLRIARLLDAPAHNAAASFAIGMGKGQAQRDFVCCRRTPTPFETAEPTAERARRGKSRTRWAKLKKRGAKGLVLVALIFLKKSECLRDRQTSTAPSEPSPADECLNMNIPNCVGLRVFR